MEMIDATRVYELNGASAVLKSETSGYDEFAKWDGLSAEVVNHLM